MVMFLADRTNLQRKRLHDHIKHRFRAEFDDVRRRRADPGEPGAYRVVGEVDPRAFLDDSTYPTCAARIEVGFRLRTGGGHEHYWFNWIEPEREMLVGWHRDDTHADLGPVHAQVNHGSAAVAHRSARFVDSHPLDVVGQRLAALAPLVRAVEWDRERPSGFDSAVSEL